MLNPMLARSVAATDTNPVSIRVDTISSVATTIAENVSRSQLHQILLESRLMPRDSTRDDLRRVCPTNREWVHIVVDKLGREESRLAAFRALSALLTAYVCKPGLDHRAESSFRKGRQAAERGDLERVRRELDKLLEYSPGIRSDELSYPAILLYLYSGSDRARESVLQVLGSEDTGVQAYVEREYAVVAPADAPVGPAIRASSTLSNLTSETAPTVAPPVEVVIGKKIAGSSALSELTAELEGLADPVESPKAQWNFESLVRTRLPEDTVEWPSMSDMGAEITRLLDDVRTGTTGVEQERDLNRLPGLRQQLELLKMRLQLVGSLVGKLDALDQSVRSTIESKLSLGLPELSEDADAIRQELSAPDCSAYPLTRVEGFLKKNRALAEEKLARMLAVVDRIAGLTSFLPVEAQTVLEHKTRHILLTSRADELDRLRTETEARTEEPRRVQEQSRKAAADVLRFLRVSSNILVTPEVCAAVRKAVLAGDAEKGIAVAVPPPKVESQEVTSDGKVAVTASHTAAEQTTGAPGVSPQQPLTKGDHEIAVDLTKFVPRDRQTAREPALPKDGPLMLQYLLDRAIREIRRDSTAGAIDHALDILKLAGIAKSGADYWSGVGLAVIAALPTPPITEAAGWGTGIAEPLERSLTNLDASTLPNYVASLLTQPNFDEAIAERFVYEEVLPFAEGLARALYAGTVNYRHFLLEDVARGVALGAVYGDPPTAKKLLLELVRHAAADSLPTVERMLDASRRHVAGAGPTLPEWIDAAVRSYNDAISERSKQSPLAHVRATTATRTTSRATQIRVQVPPSVIQGGGFGVVPGSEQVDFALLVSNLENRPVVGVEIALPAVRNPWLAGDVVCGTGPIGASSSASTVQRHLVNVSARLAKEISESVRLEMGLLIRYKDVQSHETQYADTKLDVGFAANREVEIQSYEGAGGKPLILQGDALKYSSSSVRKALAEIVSGLKGKGVAALVIGRRRRGKTSILRTVERHPDVRGRYSIVADSWEDLPSGSLGDTLKHLGNVFDRAARALNVNVDSLEQRIRSEYAAGWMVVQQWIEQFTERLSGETRLLLLIDEFQKWVSLLDPEARTRLLSLLRGLFNRPEGGKLSISIVLSGLSNIREFTKSSADFENAFHVFNVEPFTIEEAAALIRSNPSIEFDSRAVVRIRELAGGNPFLINLFGNDIAARLRELRRAYCLPEDVERVVRGQLEEGQNSRVWSFLQYLLKEGEEDHAAAIPELPSLRALAHALRVRGSGRRGISLEEIAADMSEAQVPCDSDTLLAQMTSAANNELVVRQGSRYAFANGWLAEWLSVDARLLPVEPQRDKDLVLGRFRIVKLLDRGGQAAAWEAQDVHFSNRSVVVKIYQRAQGKIVIREAEALSKIEHHAVVRCIEFGEDPDKGDVIVLEHARGDKLRKLLSERPKYATDLIGHEGSLSVQVKFIEQMVGALGECHEVGIVHKDLKPENIIAQQSEGIWFPKIIDFGLATDISDLGPDIKTMGSYTPGYVAPERYKGEGRRAPADIYSLGVIAYELLTGRPPFPGDPLQAREAQENGTFLAPKECRPEITTRLSELICEMMSVTPADRPNAYTVLGRLAPALRTQDWTSDFEAGKRAYESGDAETAFECFERAAFSAPQEGRRTREYVELTAFLIDAATACGKVLMLAPRLMQSMMESAIRNPEGIETFKKFVKSVIEEPAVDPNMQEPQRSAIQILVDTLSQVPVQMSFASAVQQLLRNPDHPAVSSQMEELYLIAVGYKDAGLIDLSQAGNLCLTSSRRSRERDANLGQAQLWLRRAQYLGISASLEYRNEQDAVSKLLNKTATPPVLPRIPADQEHATIGEKERANLNVERITAWVDRLLRLHPYVQSVKRVRKDPGLALVPTRILPLDRIAQHLPPGTSPQETARIIPAVLDESFCRPKGQTVLRINIVLAEGTTLAEREAAIAQLRADGSVFGVDW